MTIKLDNLHYISYRKNNGDLSERLIFSISEVGDTTLALDLTEFQNDDSAYTFATALQMLSNGYNKASKIDEASAADAFNYGVKDLGLGKQYRNFKTSRIQYV